MSTTSAIISGFSLSDSDLATNMLKYSKREFYDRSSSETPRKIRILLPKENRHIFCDELVTSWISAHPAKFQPALRELMGRVTFFPQSQFERLLAESTEAFIDSLKDDEKYTILMENHKSNAWVPALAKTLCPRLKADKNIKPLGIKAAQSFATFLKSRVLKFRDHIRELNDTYRELILHEEYKASLLALSSLLQTAMSSSSEHFSQTDELLLGMFSFLGKEEALRKRFGFKTRPTPLDMHRLRALIERKVESIQKSCNLLSKTIVLFDDASYSGKQLCEHVTGIIAAITELNVDLAAIAKTSRVELRMPVIRPEIKIICPVMSETALRLITDLRDRNRKFRISLFHRAVCRNVGSCLSDTNNLLIKELWGKASLQLSTMYFDHKLPNSTSFPTQIFRGSVTGQEQAVPFVRPYDGSCMLEPYKVKDWCHISLIKDSSDTSSDSSGSSSRLSVSTVASPTNRTSLELPSDIRKKLVSLSVSPITVSSHKHKGKAAAEEEVDETAVTIVESYKEARSLHAGSRKVAQIQPFRDPGLDLFSPMRACSAKLPPGFSLGSPSTSSDDSSSIESPPPSSVAIPGSDSRITLLLPAAMASSFIAKRESDLKATALLDCGQSTEAHSERAPLMPPLKASAEVVFSDDHAEIASRRRLIAPPSEPSRGRLRLSEGSRVRKPTSKEGLPSTARSLDSLLVGKSTKSLTKSLEEALRASTEA